MKLLLLVSSILTMLLLTGCDAGKDKTNVELFQGMFDQINNKAQDYDELSGTPSNRVPPKGTVPIGFKPYKYTGNPEAAARNLRNPLSGEIKPEDFERGKQYYETYCGVCHSNDGVGGENTKVGSKMPVKPPALISGKVAGYKDSQIFHVITDGYGLMGKYSKQIVDEKDRWRVVNYIRHLQKNAK